VEILEKDIERLGEILKDIKDERRQSGNIRHLLIDILVIAFTAILCGLKSFGDMETFGRQKEVWFRTFLKLPEGIPDKNTFQRVFRWVNPDELHKTLQKWLLDIGSNEGKVINIDGKTERGSADGDTPARHIVSAWVGENNLALGQVTVDAKSNEITAIPELLERVDVKGATVTIDAMGCQKAIAEKIIEKKGHYVLALKENQPLTYEQVKEYFDWMDEGADFDDPIDYWTSGSEKDHGRIERREAWVSYNVNWLHNKLERANLRSIIRCRGHRIEKDKETGERGEEKVFDRYYISDLKVSPERMGEIIREHWSIENQLHWMLDMNFGEDDDLKRKGHTPENLNVLRKMALTLIEQHESKQQPKPKRKRSVRDSMLNALLDDEYRADLLFNFK
jgi:predicted transposase YbfD/YdcC